MSDFKINTEIRKTFPWKLAVTFVLFSAAIVIAGIFYYRSQKKRIITEETANLAAIASLKIGQIESWRKERVGDAAVIRDNRPLVKTIRQFYSDNDKGLRKEISGWMMSVKNEYEYENVLITDISLRVRLSVNPSDFVLGYTLKREMKSALNDHRILLTDLHRSEEISFIHLDLIIPLFDSVNNIYIPVGLVVLRVDPNKVLFPLINSWPTSSKSSETLLLRRERDSVLYLNELRLRGKTALRLRLPISNKDLLATKAAKGLVGTAEGIDYRNVPVVGSLHIIPGTQWFMVAKVDTAEILAPLKRYIVFIIIVVVLLILINASIFGFWIWNQEITSYRNQLRDAKAILESDEQLRESEIRFRQTFDMSPVGIVMVGLDTRFLRCNNSFSHSLGYMPEELVGKTIAELTYPDDIQIGMADMIAIAKGELETSHVHKRYLRKDGEIVWGDVLISLIRNNSGELQYFLAIIQDITESKKIVEALRKSEERFRSLYENATIGIYRTTADGTILMANPALASMLGFKSFEELAKRNLEKEGYEPDYPRKKFIETLEQQGRIRGLESVWHKRDGSLLHVRESAVAIRDNKDKILYYDGNVEDITERKKAEESLRFKNFVFDDSIAANSIADINGNITEANDAFLRIWGYPVKDEVIGKHISSFIKSNADSSVIGNALSEFGEWEGDYIALKNDGSTFIAHGLATRIKDEKGKTVGYQSAVLDVTESKKAEEIIHKLNEELEQKVIQRTELLEAANKELEAFSYSVSHDLRAPLRSVHGYTKILVEEYQSMLDDEGKRICGIISSSATQMGELIDDLLSFSRIGRSSMNPLLLDMKSMVISVFADITSAAEKSRTKLKIGKLNKAFGDANLIKLVWTNLISNAIKYSSKENTPEISVSSQLKYDRITYSVKDNGVGFDMNYKHKLFGVFQRLHSESEFEGNGVGLAIVQRIVLKHGGKVWAEGEIDKGATFYFSLPVNGDRQQATGDRQTKNQTPVA